MSSRIYIYYCLFICNFDMPKYNLSYNRVVSYRVVNIYYKCLL